MMFGSPVPLVAAPMAGGGTTPELVSAVTAAGGFAFLPAGYKSAEDLSSDLAEVRARGVDEFGVNLFVPAPTGIDEASFRAYALKVQPDAARFGLDVTVEPLREDDDQWAAKIDLLLRSPVPVVSATFGIPPARDITALQRVGTRVLVTVTTVTEARAALAGGVDALVVQGPDAGGHSGTHDPARPITPIATADLVRDVVAATSLPVVAGGGVDGPESVRDLIAAGAQAVAVGTLLLRTDESGASQTHRDALADPAFTQTMITHAFTGRPARGLRNAFIEAHEAYAPYGYPAIHHLTRGLRQAAARAGDPNRLHLWAGTGFRQAPTGPASAVISTLVRNL